MTIDFVKRIISLRRVSFIGLAFLAIFDIGVYTYIHSFQAPRLAALQNQWFEKRRLVHGGDMLDAAGIYQRGVADLATWRARISTRKDFARVVGELFETAANNSLTMGSIGYKPAIFKEEQLLAYAVSLNVSGKYASIKSFISDLCNSREMMTIDNISLSNTSATEETVDLRVQMTLYCRAEGQ
jgi:type IV pilus assembly protein PilO